MPAARSFLALFALLVAFAWAGAAQGVPLETLLKDGLKKPAGDNPPSSSSTQPSPAVTTPGPPAVSIGESPSTPSDPARLPFNVRLPRGWRARVTEESGMLAQSADGASTAAVLPVLSLGNQSPSQWLQRSAVPFLSRYFRNPSVAAVYPSRMGNGGSLASVEFQNGPQSGKASVLLFTHGGTGTLYLIAAPAQRFSAARPTLLNILRSFSFRGERAATAPGSSGSASIGQASGASFSWKKFQDPNEQAFTVEAPATWKVEGGLIRRSTIDVSTYVRAISPEGIVVMLGDPDLRSYAIPNAMLAWTGFREGSEYAPAPGHVMIVSRYLPGPAYAHLHAGHLARVYQLSNVQLGQPRPRPDLDKNIPALGSSIRGGEIDFAAARNGKPLDGYVMAATTVMTMQGVEGGVWNVQLLVSYLAPKGMSSTARAVVSHMLGSIRLNPVWVRQQQQLTEHTSRTVRETNEYISKLFRDSYEQNQRIRDRQHQEFSDYIRGVVRLRDPESGEVLEGRTGNNYYWRIRNTDTLIGSDYPDPPPNVDVSELEQIR